MGQQGGAEGSRPLRYSDFIALGHVLVGGTSGSYGSCIFKVVSVLFSIILLVFLQPIMNKRVLCLREPSVFSEVLIIAILTGTSDIWFW